MDRIELWAVTLIVAPLAGAGFLALRSVAPGQSGQQAVRLATLVTLALAGIALAALVVDSGVVGSPVSLTLTLGPLDPAQPLAGLAWSVAPVALAVLFCWIALQARSVLLGGLAVASLAMAIWSAATELVSGSGEATAETPAALLDPLAALLLAVSVVVGGLIVLYALDYEPDHLVHRGLAPSRTAGFLAWLLLFLSAMHLLVLADDLRLLVVGWEVTTLCSFVLIGFDGDAPATEAARRALAYNLAGGLGLGVAAIALGPGASLSGLLTDAVGSPVVAVVPVALTGCLLAAAVKSALAPFHPWLLGAMIAAAPVSALLHASAMVKAGSYLALRLSPALAEVGWIGVAFAVVGGLTFAGAGLLALRQRDLKRILALSTVSTLGLIAASAGLASPAAMSAGALLLAFHAVAKALVFLVVGAVEQTTGTRDVEALVGILRTRPQLGAAYLAAAAAMALPPFGIAVAKWALLLAGASDVLIVVLFAIGGTANLALWIAVTARLLVRRPDAVVSHAEVPASEQIALGALTAGAIGGLVLAAPIAALITDPAAEAAFGIPAALASGWAVVLAGTGFSVPMVAAIVLAATVLAVAVTRNLRVVARRPYLAGANVGGLDGSFHGSRGQPVATRSGGFYWGAAVLPQGQQSWIGRLLVVGGWLSVLLLLAAGAASWLTASASTRAAGPLAANWAGPPAVQSAPHAAALVRGSSP